MTRSTTTDPLKIERDKAYLDFLRHQATLTTGAIVLLAAFSGDFVERLGTSAGYISLSIALLIASLTLNLMAYALSTFVFLGRDVNRLLRRYSPFIGDRVSKDRLSFLFAGFVVGSGLLLVVGLILLWCAFATVISSHAAAS